MCNTFLKITNKLRSGAGSKRFAFELRMLYFFSHSNFIRMWRISQFSPSKFIQILTFEQTPFKFCVYVMLHLRLLCCIGYYKIKLIKLNMLKWCGVGMNRRCNGSITGQTCAEMVQHIPAAKGPKDSGEVEEKKVSRMVFTLEGVA